MKPLIGENTFYEREYLAPGLWELIQVSKDELFHAQDALKRNDRERFRDSLSKSIQFLNAIAHLDSVYFQPVEKKS